MGERCRVVAVCGHEAAYGRVPDILVDPDVTVVPNGRELFRAIALLGRRGEPSCVVPMTFGRDPDLVADTARTLRALPDEHRALTCLAGAFGTAQHLVGWLRAAAGGVPATDALLVTAPSAGPFEDAELYRTASLVRCFGDHSLVEVAFTGGDPDLVHGVRRCALLGASRVVMLSAAFTVPAPPDAPGVPVEAAGPPVPRAALRRVIGERVSAALHRLRDHGDDGISAGLTAADEHGHHHTHPPGEDHHHTHPPGEDHHHTAGPPHTHGPAPEFEHPQGFRHPDHQIPGAAPVLRISP
ncbi:cobalamin biosynthesis protein CbiX [Actinacidiphila sp. ITFR-21]|uniref:cobalamin biosynthesis protein CbiX n=1 Tax=Actinacidiphila sp. ITFR-21 TaxID=3075199 RepID=UPI0028894A2A|nr:cobalamin biosynthesis protein CbiX [Streptomyces sp. ITFR-21]WNI16191.1 cobalamin biosynthesis protein CbiX [Streptomyces sp. ITFR-21]